MGELGYPHTPAGGQTDTSRAAAEAIASISGKLRRMVFLCISASGTRGLTNHEIAERLHLDHASTQPRTSELRRQGAIRDSGARRLNARGRNEIVWISIGGVQ